MPRHKVPQATTQHHADAPHGQAGGAGAAEEAVALPQAFTVQYLGVQPASGLWGVRYTRRPVDALVAAASASPAPLPLQRLRVSPSGVCVYAERGSGGVHAHAPPLRSHGISTISYGVQDLVYTRVFCFIVVSEPRDASGEAAGAGWPKEPVFYCHAYLCESKATARALTLALAAAFRAFSRELQSAGPGAREQIKRRYRIDLRSPEQMAADLAAQHGDSSEA